MRRRVFLSDWRLLLAAGGGAGLFPFAPGTAGTLAALPLYYALAALLPLEGLLLTAALFIGGGVYLCGYAERRLQSADDKRIVWDELAAFFAVLLMLPPGWQWQAAAFIVFRFFDALKPFPINWLDKKIKGGAGIMADDIAAAATAAVIYGAREIWQLRHFML